MSSAVTLGVAFIIAFLAIGIFQAYTAEPSSPLAGAAVYSPTQEQINGCMVECMRSCVGDESTVVPCREVCEPSCGI